jgi:hypothetical protein
VQCHLPDPSLLVQFTAQQKQDKADNDKKTEAAHRSDGEAASKESSSGSSSGGSDDADDDFQPAGSRSPPAQPPAKRQAVAPKGSGHPVSQSSVRGDGVGGGGSSEPPPLVLDGAALMQHMQQLVAGMEERNAAALPAAIAAALATQPVPVSSPGAAAVNAEASASNPPFLARYAMSMKEWFAVSSLCTNVYVLMRMY